jgi:hypothetical protein
MYWGWKAMECMARDRRRNKRKVFSMIFLPDGDTASGGDT